MPSKKHFEAIAKIVRDAKTDLKSAPNATVARDEVHAMIAEDLSEYFASQNPRFDRSRFLKACGLEG